MIITFIWLSALHRYHGNNSGNDQTRHRPALLHYPNALLFHRFSLLV